jgi:hypothetical protein
MFAGGLTALAVSSSYPLVADVILLVFGALFMVIFIPLIFMTRSDIREYRRTHDGEPA